MRFDSPVNREHLCTYKRSKSVIRIITIPIINYSHNSDDTKLRRNLLSEPLFTGGALVDGFVSVSGGPCFREHALTEFFCVRCLSVVLFILEVENKASRIRV